MALYYCERGCHVTNQDKNRCPSCNAWLKKTSEKEAPRLQERIEQMQRESAHDAAKGRYVNNKI